MLPSSFRATPQRQWLRLQSFPMLLMILPRMDHHRHHHNGPTLALAQAQVLMTMTTMTIVEQGQVGVVRSSWGWWQARH